MKPTVYDDPKKFWIEVSADLKTEEAKNSLCLGLSYIFQTDSKGCVYQSTLRGKKGLLAALICSQHGPQRNLITSPVEDIEQARELFAEFTKTGITLNGIVGEVTTANFYKTLAEETGKKTKIIMTQGIYKCREVVLPSAPQDSQFRVAEARDAETIGKWIEVFHFEAIPHDPPVNGRELADLKINRKQIYVLECKGKLVSMAAWSRDIETSCSVNLVFTPKEFRKKGFGSIVTANLTKYLLSNGKRETNLYTDMTNPTSNKIYQNIGYEFVCNSMHFGIL